MNLDIFIKATQDILDFFIKTIQSIMICGMPANTLTVYIFLKKIDFLYEHPVLLLFATLLEILVIYYSAANLLNKVWATKKEQK